MNFCVTAQIHNATEFGNAHQPGQPQSKLFHGFVSKFQLKLAHQFSQNHQKNTHTHGKILDTIHP